MSWTNPRTWVTGEVVTAAIMNSAIRDNLNFLFDPPAARISGFSASIANGTTPVAVGSMGTVVLDSTGGAMTGTANKITVTLAGLYACTGNGVWTSNATGAIRRLGLMFTGAAASAVSLVENSNSVTVEQSTGDIFPLVVNGTVQLAAAQSSGAALTLNTPTLTVSWVGAG